MHGVLPEWDPDFAAEETKEVNSRMSSFDRQETVWGFQGLGGDEEPRRHHPKSAVANQRIRKVIEQVTATAHHDTVSADGRLRLEYSRILTFGSMLAISLNSIYLGIETELADPESQAQGVWLAIDAIFTAIFAIELVLRLYLERSAFVRDAWNALDAFLVAASLLDTCVLTPALSGQDTGTLDIVSILRVLRILRIARVFKLLRFFKKLWLLSIGLVDAMRALFWAWMLILVIIYVFSILTTRMLGKPYSSQDKKIEEHFSSVSRSMFTMFQILTLEGWPDVVRNAMRFEPWVIVLFLLFLMATTYSIMSVIIAVIVESTLDQATNQNAEVVRLKDFEARKAGAKIQEVFEATDTDGSGDVTKEEFLAALKRPEVNEYLCEAGIDVRQAQNIFEILDYDESGTLTAEEFTSGIMRARGQASAKDVLALQCDLWRNAARLRDDIESLCKSVDARMRKVDLEIERMHGILRGIRMSVRAS